MNDKYFNRNRMMSYKLRTINLVANEGEPEKNESINDTT